MKKLLEDLKKLDQETYEKINDISIALHGYDVDRNPNSRTIRHIIQGEIQIAVAARGWHWRLASAQMDESERGYSCVVMHRVHSMWMDMVATRESDSPAKAILTAYLAAIRSQP
jgi:hypothetical protein